MDTEKLFKKLIAIYHKECKKDKGEFYSYKDQPAERLVDLDLRLDNLIKKNKLNRLLPYYFDLADWFTENATYDLLYKDEEESSIEKFSHSAYYAYIATMLRAQGYGFTGMDKIGFYMALNLLCGWETKYKEMAERMIYSINNFPEDEEAYIGDNIRNGSVYHPSLWFLLDLYCLQENRSYNKTKADLPKNFAPYDKVLDEWNTTDLSKVDKFVYLMAEIHILRSELKSDDKGGLEQEFYGKALFPFEILSYLQIRKQAGLVNPSSFTHMLMNEPLSKMFLSLENSVSYPKLDNLEELLKLYHDEYPERSALEILNNYKAEREDA